MKRNFLYFLLFFFGEHREEERICVPHNLNTSFFYNHTLLVAIANAKWHTYLCTYSYCNNNNRGSFCNILQFWSVMSKRLEFYGPQKWHRMWRVNDDTRLLRATCVAHVDSCKYINTYIHIGKYICASTVKWCFFLDIWCSVRNKVEIILFFWLRI